MSLAHLSTKSILIVTTALSALTILTPAMTCDPTSQQPQQRRVFTTPQELCDFRIKLHDLCNKERFQEAEQLLSLEPEIRINNLHELDREGYQFARFFSLCRIAVNKEEKEPLNIELKKSYNHQVLNAANDYLLSYATFEPKDRILQHQFVMYKKRGEAYSCLGRLTRTLVDDPDEAENALAKQYVLSAIEDLRVAFTLGSQSTPLVNGGHLLIIQQILLTEYCAVSSLCDEMEAENFLDKARSILLGFKNNKDAPEYYISAKQTLEPYEISQKQRRLVNKKLPSKKGQAFQVRKIKELEREKIEAIQEVNHNNSKDDHHSFQTQIVQSHQYLRAFALNNIENPEIQTQLQDIEKKIEFQLKAANKPSMLKDIYRQYAQFTGKDFLQEDALGFILPSLIACGQFKGALDRIEIIADFEYEKQGHHSQLILLLFAGIKALNGDYEEWLKLEEKMAAQNAKEKEKKQRAKQRKHEKKVEVIKYTQQEDKSQDDSTAKPESVTRKKAAPVKEEMYINDDVGFTSNRNEKEEKKKRHEEAEKLRETETLNSANVTTTTPTSTSAITSGTITSQSQSSVPLIRDVYQLTTIGREVDTEIEEGTWKISRKQLISYFENLQCNVKNGSKHKKIALPEALILEHQGQILTIINDLGGALTLPRWDSAEGNGTVPKYLRPQILAAREKLILLKLKERKTKETINTSDQ